MYRELPLSTSHRISCQRQISMQEDNAGAKGSDPTQKPTKYRLACDSCQHSKIRCDQERPKCRRCAKKGIECIYSPARRAGRPRTRNNSKSSSTVEQPSASQKAGLTTMTEHSVLVPALGWMSPFDPHNMLPTSDTSSSVSTNTSAISGMAHTIQMPSPEDMNFSPYQQSHNDYLQGLLDLTSSQCSTPPQTNNCYYPISPEFHIAPELLDVSFCEAERGQHQEHEQNQPTSTTMLLGEGPSFLGIRTPEELQQSHFPDQQQEDGPIQTTCSKDVSSHSYAIPAQQQAHPQLRQPLNHGPPLTKSCHCLSTLFDNLSIPSQAPPASPLVSTSAALSTSRKIITSCSTAMACPNACFQRPSAALVICEAIDRALISLRLGGTSLWGGPPRPTSSNGNWTSSSPGSASSSSSTSGDISNEITLEPSVIDEEQEPLRCGALSIRGADRRAVVRVLLVKRVLEVQGVLERLRDALLSRLPVSDDAVVKKPLLALCADVAGDFAKKVAEKVETVKLQI